MDSIRIKEVAGRLEVFKSRLANSHTPTKFTVSNRLPYEMMYDAVDLETRRPVHIPSGQFVHYVDLGNGECILSRELIDSLPKAVPQKPWDGTTLHGFHMMDEATPYHRGY